MACRANGTAGLPPLIRLNQQYTDTDDELTKKEAPGDSKGAESLDASDGLGEEVFAYGEYP